MLTMRPQHNSTRSTRKIAFDLVSVCSRLSPILRCDDESGESGETGDKWFEERAVDSGDTVENRSDSDEMEDDEIPIWICGEPRYISGITAGTTCREIIQALIDDELHNEGAAVAGGADNWRRRKDNCRKSMRPDKGNRGSRRNGNKTREFAAASRDLADYVITERWRDVEQALAAETPILPIWLAWGTARNEVRFKLKINKSKDTGRERYRNHEAEGNENDNDVGRLFAAALQPKKTKKTHKFKALANMMKRLVVQSETIQERLSQLKQIEYRVSDPVQIRPAPSSQPGKTLLMNHFLYDSATSCDLAIAKPLQDTTSAPANKPRVMENIYVHLHEPDNPIEPINIQSTDDELFLLIDDNAHTYPRGAAADNTSAEPRGRSDYPSDDLDSGVHVEYRQYVLNRKLQNTARAAAAGNCLSSKLLLLSETPKRKYRTKCDFDRLRARSLNRASIRTPPRQAAAPARQAPTQKPPRPSITAAAAAAALQRRLTCSSRRDTIRLEVAKRMLDLDELLQYEDQLQQTLAQRSHQFREQNERYRGRDSVFLANDVETIQSRLAACTADIVDGECELFKIQLEITQKCGILHNLQRMQAIAEEAEAKGESTGTTSTIASTNIEAPTSAMMEARIEAEQRRQSEQMRRVDEETIKDEQVLDTTVFVDNVHEFCDRNKSIIV